MQSLLVTLGNDGAYLFTTRVGGVVTAPNLLGRQMAAAQSGDEEAYRQLLETVTPMLIRYTQRYLSSPDAAEDVVQEILLSLHRVRHTYDPERPFEPWLYSIARSRVVDHLRRQRRISAVEVMLQVLPESTAETEMTADGAREVLERLPPTQREALTLLKIEGLSLAEAARRAGVSVSALKVRAHRAYKVLKKALSGD